VRTVTLGRADVSSQNNRDALRDFVENAAVPIHWESPDGTVLWANNAELRLLGYPAHEYIGRNIREFHIDPDVIDDILLRLNRHEELIGYKARLRCNDGSIRHVRISANVFRRRGESGHSRCIMVDVTDQRQTDDIQLLSAAIVESSDDAIISKSLDSRVTSWNSSAERIFGYTASEMIGRSITVIIPQELRSEEDLILAKITNGERIEHYESVRVTKSGQRLDVSLTISPIRDDNGRIIGAAKIARDITSRKKVEEALRTTEKIASVGRLAATVAHEINNPLEAVMNLVYLAKDQVKAGSQAHDYLALAEEELGRVSHLAKQTLGFYREEKGAAPLRVAHQIHQLLSFMATKCKNKGVDVRVEACTDLELMAVPGEFRQLLTNLLSNSIDAVSPGGTILIRAVATGNQNASGQRGIRLTIADSGTGIAVEHRSRLFEPFFTTKKDVGTGLGLWVSKGIVDRHGGRIRIKTSTRTGKSGTVVSVFLPETPLPPPARRL
jgi:PAS domain S-box-containing protein